MALIRNSLAGSIARDAVVLDLGDLREQGERMVRAARAEADRIVAAAHEERARIVAGAAEEGERRGFAHGLQDGRIEGREQAEQTALAEHRERLGGVERAWLNALAAFEAARDGLVQGGLRDVLTLSAAIAERVVKRTVRLDANVIADQLAAVLAVVVRPTELAIRINPEDRAALAAALPALLAAAPAVRHAELIDDPAIERGGCVASSRADSGSEGSGGRGGEAGGCIIDARIGVQLDRLIEAILPGAAGEPGGVSAETAQ